MANQIHIQQKAHREPTVVYGRSWKRLRMASAVARGELFCLPPIHQLLQESRSAMATKTSKNKRTLDYATAQKLSIFLGYVGADRFYMGNYWLGAFKLICAISLLGGSFVSLVLIVPWWIIDIAIIYSHRSDFTEWYEGRKVEREKKKEAARKQSEQLKKRFKNGKCTVCGGDKFQMVSVPHMNKGTTMYTSIYRVCQNCGKKTSVNNALF